MSKDESSTHSVKLSSDLKNYLTEQASLNGRSLHGEIVMRLKQSVEKEKLSHDVISKIPEGVDLSEQSELQLIELFKQIRRDQSALLDLLNSNDFAKQLFKRGFASVLK